ncbi:MAG: hypothetical protein K6F63_06625 [Lachnospiraceae bacterium]|nr:hypothetical protein [Lachnospiraceae bacterium]
MIRRLGFIVGIGFLILFAASSTALAKNKDTANGSAENEKAAETVTVDVSALEPAAGDMLSGYKDEDYFNKGEDFDTVTVEVSDLEPLNEDWLIGYKDENYYNRHSQPEFSHKTVIVAVDEEILDNAKVKALCEKYGLDITYDYNNFAMYALSSENEMSDEVLDKLIDDLSKEEGVLNVSKDYICYINSDSEVSSGFGLCTE